MWKKALACFMILAICVSVMWFANPLTPAIKASADTYTSGFSIIPEKEDATGVSLDSGFILKSQNEVTLEYIRTNVALRSGETVTISQRNDGSFLIKPSEPLKQNKVYFIDVKTQDGRTVTFTFQTKRDFTVIGSLPENRSSNVPVDTGIELYFSYPDVKSISRYFEITPKVEGRFEINGYTAVFIPKKLEPGTIYTVRVKKGLSYADGAPALAEDYVFSFETAADAKISADPYPGYLYINKSWLEFGSTEKPAIPFDIYLRERLSRADVTLKAYQFKNADDFVKAVQKKEAAPSWAPYATSRNKLDTASMTKVLEFSQSFNLETWQAKYMLFPQTLAEGFYLIELSSGDLTAQAFLQISDVSAYTLSDKDHSLFWLNDIRTGTPVKSAKIIDLSAGGSGLETDASGLVKLPRSKKQNNNEDPILELYKVITKEGKVSIINAGYFYDPVQPYQRYGYGLSWQYIQTDRTLYKPNDTVEFWGFIKSRIDGSTPDQVKVELSSGGYYYPMKSSFMGRYLPYLSDPFETLTLKTEGGFYEGSIRLPALDPGSYTITVKNGDEIVQSTYFTVENYVKPQYKLEISSDKKAVFTGEKVTFTIKASFFDGTPVSNVPLNYNINTYSGTERGQGVTDINGVLKVEYTPAYQSNMQGELYTGIHVSAQFPETGEISEYYNIRVFANDITLQNQGQIKDNKGTLNVTVSAIALETLNDEDPANDNFVGKPVANKEVNIRLWHITWEKIEIGDDYDFINKVVRKRYEYREKRTSMGTAVLRTDAEGKLKYEFAVPENEEGYYITEITTKDGNNRSMKYETWLYGTGNFKMYPTDYEYYELRADKEKYKANETVSVQVLKNGKDPLKNMRTLFVEARYGIKNYQVLSEPSMNRPFPEAYAPNYHLEGIVFTGKAYIQTSASIIYDYDEKRLNLEIKTDKESYRPGENMTITVKAVDKDGKPVAAKVNLSLVDEALLKLSGQYIDPLSQLYSWIDSGLIRSVNTRDEIYLGGPLRAGGMVYSVADSAKSTAAEMPMPMPSAAPMAQLENGSAVTVRSEFKDTALFKTIALDKDGVGTYTFKLPDNITSFSLAAAAVSSDLNAGSHIQSTKVSMPFFINDALSLDYLAGDKPYVGLSAYGEGLKENEQISFEITIKEMAGFKQTGTAKAFERIDLALPTLTEGTYTLVMKATSASGLLDALSRTITVYPSYRTIETASYQILKAGMKPDAGKSGMTTLIFADAGRGKLINALHALSWDFGKRLDQKLVAYTARELLKELVKNESFYYDPIEVVPSEYKNDDGGYGILPYAGSDMAFTALITPLLKEDFDTTALKVYFYNALLSEEKVQAAALYGLAELGEPVLLDLERAASVQNLSLDDYLFLGMAYEALGDQTAATDIYLKKVAPNLDRYDTQIRVKIKNEDIDTAYRQTAMAAAFASRIDHADASKLYAYVENNFSKTYYAGVERLLYLKDQAEKLSSEDAGFTYSFAGRTVNVELKDGYCEVIKIPSVKVGEFKISNVTGNVSVVSLFTKSFTENVKNDSGITITRKYYNANTGAETTSFQPGDLIKVEISYSIDKTAIDNTYEISDYAPAGLKPLSNPWNYGVRDLMGCWYRQFDGQKVTFVVGKYNEQPKPLVYYARVASPGEYTAEGTVAQGSIVKSSIATLPSTKITIK